MSDRAFEFLNSIMKNGNYLMNTKEDEKAYPAFFINRGLSQHVDCILAANELNMCGDIDSKLHYDYLFHTIRKRSRPYGKWATKKDNELIKAIAHRHNINHRKAAIYADLMSQEAKDELMEKVT